MTGTGETTRVHYSDAFGIELLKLHYRFTDEQWELLSRKEQLVKILVFQEVLGHPELRL